MKFAENMKRQLKRVKLQYWLIGTAVLVFVVILCFVYYRHKQENRTYVSYDVEMSKELSGMVTDSLLPIKEGILRYSRDGATVFDEDGETVWNVSYNMSDPVAATCGSCAAIGDRGGKSLYIFDGTGSANPITTEYPIQKVEVANQGVTAVWMDDGSRDYIILYKINGSKLVEMNTITSASGFPIDIALSDDGTKLLTSYVNFEEEKMMTQLTFYNFGEVGANYVDGLVGLEKFENRLIGDVVFINNDTVVAFENTGVTVYRMEEIQEKICEIPISETIISIAYSDKYIGLLLDSKTGNGNYTARIYTTNGKLVDERSFVENYENFRIDGEEVLLYDNLQIYIYRIDGKDKFSATLAKNVNHIYSVDGKSRYVLVGDTVLERIRLIGEKE